MSKHLEKSYCSEEYDEFTAMECLNNESTVANSEVDPLLLNIQQQPLIIDNLNENIDSNYSVNMTDASLWQLPLLSVSGTTATKIHNQTVDNSLPVNPILPEVRNQVVNIPSEVAERSNSVETNNLIAPNLELNDSSSLDISYLLSTPTKSSNTTSIDGPGTNVETLNTPQKDVPDLRTDPLQPFSIAQSVFSDQPPVFLVTQATPPNRRLAPKPSSNSKPSKYSPLKKKLSPKSTPTKLKFILPKQRQIKIRRQVLKSKPPKDIPILSATVIDAEEILATPLPEDTTKESDNEHSCEKNAIDDEADDVLGEEEELEDEEDNSNTQQEEHLAALFKASSTIAEKRQNERRNSGGHKLNKQQRRLQTRIAALTSSESDQDNTNTALNFLKRAKEVLLDHPSTFDNLICALQEVDVSEEMPETLFTKVARILEGFPVIVDEFVMFLKPHQAMRVGKYKEYCAGLRLRDFVQKLQHLSDQHQVQIQKLVKVIQIMQNINASSDDIDDLKAKVAPILRYHDLMESFALCFSSEPPPPCLASDYEDMVLDSPGTPDSCEHINLLDEDQSASPDRPCHCRCHSSQSPSQVKQNHCKSCDVRFIDGRVYIHSGRTLRPAKVTYLVNKDNEKDALKVNAKTKNARRLKNTQGNRELKS